MLSSKSYDALVFDVAKMNVTFMKVSVLKELPEQPQILGNYQVQVIWQMRSWGHKLLSQKVT